MTQREKSAWWREIARRGEIPKGNVAALFALGITIGLVDVLSPWPLQILVDYILGGKSPPTPIASILSAVTRVQAVALVILVGLLLRFTRGILEVIRTNLSVSTSQEAIYRLRRALFEVYLYYPLLAFRRGSIGDKLYRLDNDAYCIDQLYFSGAIPLIEAGFTLIAMFVILCQFEPVLAIVSLGAVPLLMISIRYYLNSLELRTEAVKEQESRVITTAEQMLSALPLVKAFTGEERENKRFNEICNDALTARRALTGKEALFNLSCEGATSIGTSLVLAIGSLYVAHGTLSVGSLIVLLTYVNSVYGPLHSLSATIAQIRSAKVGAERILSAFSSDSSESYSGTTSASLDEKLSLQLDHVSFAYAGTPVLDDVTLHLKAGTVTALIGPTGAGKSTIVSLLMRFFPPTKGRVLINGRDATDIPIHDLRRSISIVLQDSLLFPTTIEENIRYGRPEASFDEVLEAAKAARVHDFIVSLPDGYSTVVAERASSLSGGERQRISIARAFLKNAPILILDEPTSSLDAETEASLLASIMDLAKNKTTLIIAHRLSTVRNADSIVILNQGRIQQVGTHDELMLNDNLYRRFYSVQTGTHRSDFT